MTSGYEIGRKTPGQANPGQPPGEQRLTLHTLRRNNQPVIMVGPNDHFNPEEIVVLTESGRLIGYMQVEDQHESLWLRMIVIHPEYQGQGIGRCVLGQLIEKANRDAKDVALMVFKINTDARRFYERFGFKVEGETVTHFNLRRKRTELPNKASHATSGPAQKKDSSAKED